MHWDQNGYGLVMDRCPQCGIANPRLTRSWDRESENGTFWLVFVCASCEKPVMIELDIASTPAGILTCFPEPQSLSNDIPDRAREYLRQATESFSAPAGAIMLAASAVDAMLKAKGKISGALNTRINEAAAEHMITPEMAEWGHEVRLDANDQRHADEDAPLPTTDDAKRTIEFAKALAHFLFVLPARVKRGRVSGGGDASPDA